MNRKTAMTALRASIRFSNEICAMVENPGLAPVWRTTGALAALKHDLAAMQALVDAIDDHLTAA